MSRLQILVVAITIGLNALDGFDVLSISFASPGIAREWGIDRAALGIVLSMELVGMAIGSIFLGGVADKIGRRPSILGCLVVMASGMLMATTVKGIVDLSIWRIVTGLGIGGMLAAINAVAAEFSNRRRRDLSRVLFRRDRHRRHDSSRLLLRSRIGALARPEAAKRSARKNQPCSDPDGSSSDRGAAGHSCRVTQAIHE
jgi:MFS family permease